MNNERFNARTGVRKRFLAMALFFPLSASAYIGQQENQRTSMGLMSRSANLRTVSARKLALVPQADQHTTKGVVILKWTLKNVSEKVISFRDTNVFLDYKITVKNQYNSSVKLTERGRESPERLTFPHTKRRLPCSRGRKQRDNSTSLIFTT